ncbi:hypothetical protein BN1708_020007 [Verticillium longisporum]|uniref:Uncharacterized protein n=1 Tax=Verticillium longisporum TaxID=100787 RepID=A0A0G4MQV6_VERLO|nr:hypothetical protein BN1708_020007 [Verticillium longisporum]
MPINLRMRSVGTSLSSTTPP